MPRSMPTAGPDILAMVFGDAVARSEGDLILGEATWRGRASRVVFEKVLLISLDHI